LIEVVVPRSVKSIGIDAFSYTHPDLKFKVHADSYAQAYARSNYILYELIDESSSLTGKLTVFFNTNGGDALWTATKQVTPGQTYGLLPIPMRVGYFFKGWFTSTVNGSPVTQDTIVTRQNNHTLYAMWGEPSSMLPDGNTLLSGEDTSSSDLIVPSANRFTIKFNANGGSVSSKSKAVAGGSVVGSLPTPKRTGYNFKGWYTKKSGGAKVSVNTIINSNKTFYAQWETKSYKATFNANKGKISGKAKLIKKTKYSSKLGKLKTPKRPGYKFKGWYTKKSGGKKIKASTKMPAKNVTYYARWEKK
jgi:uncharacterized repeat protein (TIGR02543 family)